MEKYNYLREKYVIQHQTLGTYIEFLNTNSLSRLKEIIDSLDKFEGYLSINRERYIDVLQKTEITTKYDELTQPLRLFTYNPQVSAFFAKYANIENSIKEFNEHWIKHEIKRNEFLLGNIDNKSLDEQQRVAVVSDDINNLVVAGAGSGKTLTIAGKVKYLVEVKGYKPEEILLISYTSKSAQEMSDRISGKLGINVDAKTFHKLGLDIIAQKHKKRPDISENPAELIKEYFREEIIKSPEKVDALVSFLSYYLKIPADIGKYKSLGSYIEENSDFDSETLREKYNEKREMDYIDEIMVKHITVKQEKVKSMEEVMIANFLFLNGIEYEYERNYEIETADETHRTYKPDFYLPKYKIYIEHFGLDRQHRAPWLPEIKGQQYVDEYYWKKNLHQTNNTQLIESYSYYNSEGILLSSLEEKLKEAGVEFIEADKADIYRQLYQNQNDKYFNELVKLVNAFISLLKANRKGLPEIAKFQMESEQIKNTFQRNRTRLFFKIVRGAYAHYSDYLDKTNKIDFHDMINDAADIVAAREVKLPYRYIIIDEFQDTSMSRYNLVKAIKEENSARLFCVGDDWQSIYRFAGSDLEIFTGFDKMVGETNLLKIENTYRNPQSLIDIAGNFVMSNNNQYRKNLISSNKKHEQPVCIVGYEKDPMDAFERAINDIVKAIPEVREVMIIGRNNFDISFIDNFSEFKKSYSKKEDAIVIRYSKYPDIRFQYLTAHRSKGLEAEATIIINVNNNSIGFPNKIADDALLGYILTKREPYRFAEERRLFYVALTRTRNLTYITTKHASRSEFVIELIERYKVPYVRTGNPNTEERVVHCPECIKGQLISKKKYVYCSNYPRCEFGTGYTEIMKNPIECPRCHYFLVDRVMKRNGHHFLGCMNYPRCSHTEEYDS